MKYTITEIKNSENKYLEEFLYEAIFIPNGFVPPARDIIYQPELRIYIEDFGNKKGDYGIFIREKGKIIGVVWTRIINDYGHIDDDTPSLAISVLKKYRHNGIGTVLMKKIITDLKERGYKQISLSVQKENYAFNMYKKVGFEIFTEKDEEYIMLYRFK